MSVHHELLVPLFVFLLLTDVRDWGTLLNATFCNLFIFLSGLNTRFCDKHFNFCGFSNLAPSAFDWSEALGLLNDLESAL